MEQNLVESHTRNPKNFETLKGAGRGRGIMVGRGQAAGLRGNSLKVDLHQRVGAQVATTGAQVHRGQTHRPNARGIRAKPQTNTTAGETNKPKSISSKENFSLS